MNIFSRIYREIENYFYLRKTIKQQENNFEWKAFNLRRDWIFRIYTVVSLDQEFIDQVSGFEITHAVLEAIDPINKYLGRLEFGEIVAPTITRVEGTTSWLVVYNPLFRILTMRHITVTLIILGMIIFGYEDRTLILHLISLL